MDTVSSADLDGVDFGSVAWGDIDSDGDQDLLVTGRGPGGNPTTSIYLNEIGGFSILDTNIPGVSSSAVALGDYDNDGYLDVALSGKDQDNQIITKVFRNEAGASAVPGQVSYTDSGVLFTGVQAGSVSWGDYDNDGDLDLLVAGNTLINKRVTQIYRNDLDPISGERTFVDINAGLAGIFLGNAVWADYDNDGDLDVIIAGSSSLLGEVTIVYRNDEGIFVDAQVGLPGWISSTVVAGDYDNDGDLDVFLSGNDSQNQRQARIYTNNRGQFFDIGEDLEGFESGEAGWGDYDNDGDLDLLTTGKGQGTKPFTTVYENQRGEFVDIQVDMEGLRDGLAAWADYDNDGDLDILTAGLREGDATRRMFLYQNNTQNRNTPPQPPSNLQASFSGKTLWLQWQPAVDAETPSPGLSYNVSLGRVDNGDLLVAPMASPSGYRKLPTQGNAQHNTFYKIDMDVRRLSPAPFLTWNVQAVDPSYTGSAFSETGNVYLAGEVRVVEDVPEDQGGMVILRWEASHLDKDAALLTHYSIWRALPDTVSVGAGSLVEASDITPEFNGTGIRKITKENQDTFWEWIGNQMALGQTEYVYSSPTLVDSSSKANGVQQFMIAAHTDEPDVFFDSEPLAGYSVDNLPPQIPQQVRGVKGEEGVLLEWEASSSADLRHYLVFRGDSPGFDVGIMEPFAIAKENSFLDTSSFAKGTLYYKIVAEDENDNRSLASEAVAVVILTSAEGESSEIPETYRLHQNYPNPFNPSTRIQFDLPDTGWSRVSVYNAFGQRVAVLIEGIMPAGRHSVSWQPVGLSSGTYYYRLESGSFSSMKKMVFVK